MRFVWWKCMREQEWGVREANWEILNEKRVLEVAKVMTSPFSLVLHLVSSSLFCCCCHFLVLAPRGWLVQLFFSCSPIYICCWITKVQPRRNCGKALGYLYWEGPSTALLEGFNGISNMDQLDPSHLKRRASTQSCSWFVEADMVKLKAKKEHLSRQPAPTFIKKVYR